MRDVKEKTKNNAPKVMDRTRDIGASMKKAVNRAKANADIYNEQYDSPTEYAEAELSEIAHDGVEITRKTVHKAGRKARDKLKERIKKQIDKKRSDGKRKEKRRGHGRRTSADTEPANGNAPRNSETIKPDRPAHSKPTYPEAKPNAKPKHYSVSPKHSPKNAAATAAKAPAKTVKGASQTVKTAEKSAKVAARSASKAAKETAKAAEKAAQATKAAAEKAAQATKAAAQAAAKAAQVIAKAIAAAAKAAAAAVKELVAAIIAGGWISLIIILVVALVALLICSAFGIFATEDMTGCKPMSEIIAEINLEYHSRMENDALAIDIGNYDALMVCYSSDSDGDAPVNNWNDVIAVFAVYCSTDPEEAMDVIELTDISIDYIRRIFYEMNWYELTTDGRYDEEEEMWVKTVYINQYSMDYREAADYFGFNDYQREILYEMMKPEYCSYYARLMGIDLTGNTNVNDILAVLPGTKGGDVARAALSKLGAPYVLGAKGDDKFDCSGLVCWSISKVDPELGAHFWVCAADQAHYCESMTVEQSELQPGDLVFWKYTGCSGCGRWNEIHHVGIYIGMGKVIEASSSKGRVVIRDLWSTESYPIYMFARPY